MLQNAYTIYDNKALTYSPPFFCNAHGQAVRLVMELANDTGNQIGRFPADFSLHCVGTFDDASGLLMPSSNREFISDCLPLVRTQPDLFAGMGGRAVSSARANGAAVTSPQDVNEGETNNG